MAETYRAAYLAAAVEKAMTASDTIARAAHARMQRIAKKLFE
jgi:hypothetical protein